MVKCNNNECQHPRCDHFTPHDHYSNCTADVYCHYSNKSVRCETVTVIPPQYISDGVSNEMVTNPDYKWYMKGREDARKEYELARQELDNLARQLTDDIQALRAKKEIYQFILK